MDLSNDLISKFVKITNDGDKKKTKEGTVYGTAVKYDGNMYVKIDGSDLLTPIDTTADIKEGERVTIMIKDHNATVTGNITSPSTNEGAVTKKVTEAVDGIEDKVITEVETLVADRVSTKELDAEVARIDELIAGKATIEDLEATNAKIDNLEVGDLKAINAEIENLKANKAEIGDLTATNATIGTLDAKVANIDTLVNGNLTSDNILSFNITSKNTTMEDAFIKDAMIDRITANKIMSGVIDTNNVVIQSTDGSMLLQGNILQMKDESGKVRIQIGKDTGGNFTFVLYDETGKGVLIDEEGIKSSDAIADGLIVDAKVADNANISGSKLDIASVITEVNKDNSTTIKSSKIYLNEQNQSLEVAFNSLKSQVETIQDVTINGDLSSIVEQVQSNTTKIEANKEGINTLVAENVIRTEEISDLEGELQQVNTTLSNKYASLEQNINGFKTTVSDTYTTKEEFNNLEVGGRNLVLNSGPTTLERWNNLNVAWSMTIVDCSVSPTGYAIRSACNAHTSSTGGVYSSNTIDTIGLFADGETYTISAWIRASKVFPIDFYFERMKPHSIYLSTEWQHYTYTGIYDAKRPNHACIFYVAGSNTELNMWFEIHSLKIEKGGKATDWTPAPEDVQGQIDAVDGKFANYSTTTQMNSAINQKANEITSSVSSTYTTKTEFNNLEVGGRNLFIGSKDYAAGTWFNKSLWLSNGTTSDGLIILSKSAPWGGLYQSFTMKPNEVYTMSAYIKGDGKATVNCYGNGSILKRSFSQGETASTTWRRYWFTCENTSSSDVSWTGRFENGIDNATLQIYGIKCEKGNKATDWTPAPEDVQANIDNLQVGGRNYALSSNTEKSTPDYTYVIYDISTKAQTELQGKEVTISFEAKKTSGTANMYAYLRDPSIGSISPESDSIGDITTSYKRYSVTFTAPSDLSRASQIGINSTSAVGLYVRNVKLEKGNMPTDWTPAPEDVQGQIDAVDGKFANYSTTTQMNSAINQKANEITSSVSSTYTTKTEFQNLEVGGRNYLTEAKRLGVKVLTAGTGSTLTVSTNHAECPHGYYLLGAKDGGSSIRIPNVITSNGVWTVSFELKGSQSATVAFLMDICDLGTARFVTTTDNKWVKHSLTVNVTNYSADIFHFIDLANLPWAYVYIRNIKVEKGGKATDWTPAPEDVQANIDAVDGKFANYSTTTQMNSAIQQKANEITSSVSSTYTTKTEFNNLQIGGRNLIRQSVMAGYGVSKFSHDKNTATWTLTAIPGAGEGWGAGLVISGDSVRIPYGKTYVLSFEIKVPRACSWNIDVNNYAVTGSSWGGNDNDSGSARVTSSKSLVANQWIKCWSRISNTSSLNTDKVDIYDFSHFGVVMQNETSDMTFQIRNIQGEIGNIPSEYTPAPEDVQSQIDTINTNLTTYATKSELTQTNNSIVAKFSESGGYNLIRNSTGAGGNTNGWTHTATSMGVETNDGIGSANRYYFYLDNGTTTTERYAYSSRFKLKPNTTYRFTGYFHNYTKCPSFDVFVLSSTSLPDTDTTTGYTNVHHLIQVASTNNSWKKFTTTFTTPASTKSGILRIDNNGYNQSGTNSNRVHWNCLILTEGEMEVPWSPHPSEIYDGITKIDKNGLQVSQSNYNGYTQMKADGFYVNNGSENVISITKDGSYFKGKVVITSGSTVPTSVLSGTISSAQLDSGITSDISTAKSNASTAVSTANTASTNASNAVKTANTASTNASNAVSTANTASTNASSAVSTANTASTNASNAVKTANTASTNASTAVSTANTAKSTADSVKSTVDSGKTNWTNAYNRVNEWAYGAVTGSTTIDGGYIQANTIVSDKIASGAIIAAKIAAGAVTADKISAGAITADKLAANAITSKTITGSTITGGTISGATITSETLMKTYGGMYVGSEIWGGFKKDSNGNYSSAQTFTIHGSTALQIDGNPTRISSVTGEVKIGDASSYDNLRARCLYAQEIVYTDDIRARTTGAALTMENISMRAANAYVQFTSGLGVVRVKERNHLYLQTGGNTGGDTSAEIRCTRYADASNYVNIRAHNVCAQNAVYAAGVNVSSDRARKRDIELYSTDALQEVCSTPVYAYHLDTDKDEELKRIGIIMQEAPLDAIDLTGKGVDLYQMVTMLWRAVQQQQEIINELKGE